jgi:predicted amidohydrolase
MQQASSLDPSANRDLMRKSLESFARTRTFVPDLVVFPEAFARDFGPPGSDLSGHAETMDGPFVSTMAGLAAEYDTTLVAGMFERGEDPARPYNTLAVVDEHGVRAAYRKIHLYDSFGYKESDRLSAGAVEPIVAEVGGFRLGLMTCYDLRFPELARALVSLGADVLVVPAAWVAGPGKVHHWRTLATARAIENTAFVAAVGQPGPRYTGHSMFVDPMGRVGPEQAVEDGERILGGRADRAVLDEARATNPSLANRRF